MPFYTNGADGFVYNSAPSTIPILVLSPFSFSGSGSGSEIWASSTQHVVHKLRDEGDVATFWIDTSGWFGEEDFAASNTEKYAKRSATATGPREENLTPQGLRKARAYMAAHLCQYLAPDASTCPFLRHEVYKGKVYVPRDAAVEKLLEELKVKRIKGLFAKGMS